MVVREMEDVEGSDTGGPRQELQYRQVRDVTGLENTNRLHVTGTETLPHILGKDKLWIYDC